MDDVRMDMRALAGAIFGRWLRIGVVTGLLLIITFIVLKLMTPLYESTASILVEPRNNAYTLAAGQTLPVSAISDETAVSSQIEVIKSRGNLLQVIEEEDLREVPELNGSGSSLISTLRQAIFGTPGEISGLDQIVLGNMIDRLTVVQERDSRIISISFRSKDPDLAASVANSIANVHVKRRGDLYLDDTAEAGQWLLAEIEKLRGLVAESEAKVAAYRVENDLLETGEQTSLVDQQLSSIATQISAAQERGSSARSRATLIRSLLQSGQPIDSVPDVRESVVVSNLAEEKARLQGERAQLLATLLPDHPSVKALTSQIAEINQQITIEGRQVAEALESEAKIEATLETSLRDELTRLKIQASDATTGSVGLNELEREAKAQRDLLETYLLRYRDATSRTDSNATLPDVRVISFAAAAINPVFPKTGLTLAAVAFVAIMLQVGHIMFVELVTGRVFVDAPATPIRNNRRETPRHFSQRATREPAPDAPSAIIRRKSLGVVGQKTMKSEVSQLADEIAETDPRLVFFGAVGTRTNARPILDELTADLVSRGCSTVEIDAGSRVTSSDLGLSDLSFGQAEFGEVVHRGRRSDFALVPWGQQAQADFNSERVDTFLEALADVYELVLVDTGHLGLTSSLPAFAGFEAMVILAVPENLGRDQVDEIKEELANIGFSQTYIITAGVAGQRAA